MGRIIISAGHGAGDPGAVTSSTTEAKEMIAIRDRVVSELRGRGFEVLWVPDDLTLRQTISWINSRATRLDVALEIHADSFTNPDVRGASVFHIANNPERQKHAEIMLTAYRRRVPQIPNRGVKPDTASGVGRLAICRDVIPPSLLMELGFLSNPTDRSILQNKRTEVAVGVADGLAAWSRDVDGSTSPPGGGTEPPPTAYPTINIRINGQNHAEKGIIVSSNAYIPIDLADSLGVKAIAEDPNLSKVTYAGVVYFRAIELRENDISVGWENATRTVVLRSIFAGLCPGLIDRIMGHGNTSEVQLMMFLKSKNETALNNFPEIAKLYREESSVEGVNYDIAFCQMCLETAFLQFGGDVKSDQNNFAGLGAIGGGVQGATFPSARVGVRAQVQHLKAYASTQPLVQDLVDPRFRFVTRGIAPLIGQLSGRWAADPQYGRKILALMRQLYEHAGLT